MSKSKNLGKPSKEEISRIIQKALEDNLISDRSPAVNFFGLDHFHRKLRLLKNAFPPPILNALAVKANPIISILREASKSGFGAECASVGELVAAQKAGFSPQKTVFDSPVKTRSELEYALAKGFYVNLDNIQEMMRVDDIIKKRGKSSAGIGLRINPEVGMGEIEATSTAASASKFGVTVSKAEEHIRNAPRVKNWLHGLHLHVGSQGCSLSMLVKGVKIVVEFAEKLRKSAGLEIETIDIGGGLPIRYKSDDKEITFEQYASALKQNIPELFNYNVITEFGRSVFTDCGWTASRVEYVKETGSKNIAITHVGSDLLLRSTCMNWFHEIILLDKNGCVKPGDGIPWEIAGPLCFSGDFIAKERRLPRINPGDILIVKDTGGYTFSMWSHYNSRSFPPIYGYDDAGRMSLLRQGEMPEDAAAFWE